MGIQRAQDGFLQFVHVDSVSGSGTCFCMGWFMLFSAARFAPIQARLPFVVMELLKAAK
jgi:hypothetical protein